MHLTQRDPMTGNDIYGTLTCEHCGHKQKLRGGYNDAYYHNNVMPKIKCDNCGLDRNGDSKQQCGHTGGDTKTT
jgi:hypothetical protein